MNLDNKIVDRDRDNKDRDRDRLSNEVVTTSLRNSKPSLNRQVQDKILEYQNINLNALNEWLEYKKYKAINGVTKVLNFLSLYNLDTQQQIVDNSIMNNYKGLFEPKGQRRTKTSNNVNVAKEWLDESEVVTVDEAKAIQC